MNAQDKIEHLIANGYSIDIRKHLNDGITLFKGTLNTLLPFWALYFFVLVLSNRLPQASSIVSLFVQPCIEAGTLLVIDKHSRKIEYNFENCLDGFKIFSSVFLISILAKFLSVLGLFCLIIPGLYLFVAFSFSLPFVIFFGEELIPALKLSLRLSNKNFMQMALLALICLGINLLGALLFGSGIIITYPLTSCICYCAFRHIFGYDE